MPNLPISQLPELTAITSNAEYAVAQDGVTARTNPTRPAIPSAIITLTQI